MRHITLFLLLAAVCLGNVAEHLQDISVTIQSKSRYSKSEGSGVLIVRKIDNENVTFVLTCAHVVDNVRNVTTSIMNGQTIKQVEFDQVDIVKELVEDGRKVGEIRMSADVIKYSDADKAHDLAVLMVRSRDFDKSSTRFHLNKTQPIIPIGTELYHVGSLLGQFGANSMTSGIMSQVGRIYGKVEFDQTTVTAFPGSSGGGVFLKDGTYIGMVVRGAGEGFNLIVPIRRLTQYLQDNEMMWLIDPNIKTPTLQEIESIPIERTPEEEKLSTDVKSAGTQMPSNIKKLPRVVTEVQILLNDQKQ